MAFRWCADDCPTLIAGLKALLFSRGSGPVLLSKTYIFVIFQVDPDDPLSPTLDPRMEKPASL